MNLSYASLPTCQHYGVGMLVFDSREPPLSCSQCASPWERFPKSADKLPTRPAAAVHYPTFAGTPGPRLKRGQAVSMRSGFGMITIEREISASRTMAGETQILCRYGSAEKWYEVAA